MTAPRISFVVPCYNYGRFLPECLNSIFNQEGNWDFEVIAIDDASTDDTKAVLAHFADPRLRVMTHEANQGHIKTISEGLLASRGELVARIDPDDRYRPCFLNEVVPKFDAYPEVALVYGNVDVINAAGTAANQPCDTVHGGRDFKGNEFIPLLMSNFICAPTVIARRVRWLETLPVPDHLAFSDWYFTLMIARRYEFYYVDRILADYRVHNANHHARIVLDRSEEASIQFLLDHIFEQQEEDLVLHRHKGAARRVVYGAQYWTLANKYFGAYMNRDARRCYLKAMGFAPRHALSLALWRRLLATFIKREWYERSKLLLKSARAT